MGTGILCFVPTNMWHYLPLGCGNQTSAALRLHSTPLRCPSFLFAYLVPLGSQQGVKSWQRYPQLVWPLCRPYEALQPRQIGCLCSSCSPVGLLWDEHEQCSALRAHNSCNSLQQGWAAWDHVCQPMIQQSIVEASKRKLHRPKLHRPLSYLYVSNFQREFQRESHETWGLLLLHTL